MYYFNVMLMILLAMITKSWQREQSFLLKDSGKIVFFENEKTIKFEVDLRNYYKNADLILNTTKELSIVCNELVEKHDCEYFVNSYTQHAQTVKNNVNIIKEGIKKRHRRSIGRWIGKRVSELLKNFAYYTIFDLILGKSDSIMNNESERKVNIQELELQKRMIEAEQKLLNETKMEIELRNKEKNKYDKYLYMMNVIDMLYSSHLKDTMNFKGLMSDQLKSTFLNVVQWERFKMEKDHINSELLLSNLTLPELDILDIIHISRMESRKNETHIIILVHLPVLSIENSFGLYEYIPIPFNYESETLMLNLNPGYFYRNNSEIRFFAFNDEQFCKKAKNWTFCNTLATEIVSNDEKCLKSILDKDIISESCKYRILEKKNYAVELSAQSTYCYVITPLSVKIDCEDSVTVHDLIKSREIFYNEECIRFRAIDYLEYNRNYLVSEVSYEFLMPNFTVFDIKSNNWSNDVEIIRKYMIKLDELMSETNEIESEYIKTFKKNTWKSIWSYVKHVSYRLFDFFLTIWNLIPYLSLLMIIPFVIYLLHLKYKSTQVRKN